MLGTASVLFASPAWAQGADDPRGVVFGLGAAFVGLSLVAGGVLLFLTVTKRERPYVPLLEVVSGLGKVVLGAWFLSLSWAPRNDAIIYGLIGGIFILSGIGEIIVAGLRRRASRNGHASQRAAQD
ncbi:hypothetical protein [Corallococcus aberystwythensis]|nr:hypothetical protein [Corallococcus aberystwythensis]